MNEHLLGILFSNVKQQAKAISLLYSMGIAASPKELKEYAASIGYNRAKDWNIPNLFSRSNGEAISKSGKWQLTSKGESTAESFGLSRETQERSTAFKTLEASIDALASDQTRSFLREALACLRTGSLRAAVIMSWVAAVHTLQNYVVAHCLADFNAEATRRDIKWRPAKNSDDLARLKESDFLDILEKIGLLQKNVKAEIKGCLDRRNGCGHPNIYKLSELTAAHHVDTLTMNIFASFA
jgi:hypothetical protein